MFLDNRKTAIQKSVKYVNQGPSSIFAIHVLSFMIIERGDWLILKILMYNPLNVLTLCGRRYYLGPVAMCYDEFSVASAYQGPTHSDWCLLKQRAALACRDLIWYVKLCIPNI